MQIQYKQHATYTTTATAKTTTIANTVAAFKVEKLMFNILVRKRRLKKKRIKNYFLYCKKQEKGDNL